MNQDELNKNPIDESKSHNHAHIHSHDHDHCHEHHAHHGHDGHHHDHDHADEMEAVEQHDHSNDPELEKYKSNEKDILESEEEILKDERRSFGHYHEKGVHRQEGHPMHCECNECVDEEDCDYCGKDLAHCRCDYLGNEYKRGLYHLEHLDCMECAAIMEGKIREMGAVFFASISFQKKELRIISRSNPDTLIPSILRICRSIDERVGIVPPADKTSFKTEMYEIPTLDCAACALKLEKLINNQPGVLSASISYATKTMRLTAENPDALIPELTRKCNEVENPTEICKKERISKAAARVQKDKKTSFSSSLQSEKGQLIIGGLIFTLGMLFHYTSLGMFAIPYAEDILFLISYLILGGPIVFKALKNITHGEFFDETFLMAIATLGAVAIHEYPEAVGVMFFYRVGEYFQDLASDRSRDQIMEAVDLRPEVVQRIKEGDVETVPAEDAQIGDMLIIRPGDRIPLDGIIAAGDSQLDTSAVTGEPKPVQVTVGDAVDSGCVNMTGTLTIQVEKVLAESMVSRILDSVENAVASKPKIDRFITRFSRIYTPIVVLIAAAVAVIPPLLFQASWEKCIYTALTFLVISCPCALVISVPLSFFAGIGAASKEGILFKGGTVMEALAKSKAAVLDKTGTLTEGKFAVREIKLFSHMSENEVLALAAGGEVYSTHPIARSIVTAAEKKNLKIPVLAALKEIAGRGITGEYQGKSVYIGNKKLMESADIFMPDGTKSGAGSEVWIAADGKVLGLIFISDAIKKDTIQAVEDMKALGVTPVMLTGDVPESAAIVGKKVGIEDIHAGLLPQDKLIEMQRIRSEKGAVLFVGDGINDAPVLAGADVGAAMGSGADAAIEAADLVFLNSNVSAIPQAIRISRDVIKTAWQNVFFALVVKIAVMIMGLLGHANMWVAVFADTGVTILCILYSVRLLRKRF
ncbi:MAG: heavy metal translocating P-type ATPase [Dialister sp.]|nr:heavy metal translocating P-type ATPase [Dialister sp.]